jgi:membrane-bound ClpP family serine protease
MEWKYKVILLFIIAMVLVFCGFSIMIITDGLIGQLGVLLFVIGLILCISLIYAIYQNRKH